MQDVRSLMLNFTEAIYIVLSQIETYFDIDVKVVFFKRKSFSCICNKRKYLLLQETTALKVHKETTNLE
jgi:hypothetical protein